MRIRGTVCSVFAATLSIFIPLSGRAQTAVTLSVNWGTPLAVSSTKTFGTNDFRVIYEDDATDTNIHNLLKADGLRLFRFHNASLSNAWSDGTTRTWNASLIERTYATYNAVYGSPLPTIVQNISNWPAWMTQSNGILDPSEYDEYARFCADLVRIVNLDLHAGVVYWEPLNEMEKTYSAAGKLSELWTIYNKAAQAMKAVDPTIKVGGPALTWDDRTTLASFLQASGNNVDFVSWHRYNGGDATISTDSLLANTPNYAGSVNGMRSTTQQYLPNKTVELLLGEYNINYNYQSGENRQNTSIGALWFASVQKYLAESGVNLATQWNARDAYYGLYDSFDAPRLSATVFDWTNHYFVGNVVQAISTQASLEGFAVSQTDGSKSLLIINKASTPMAVTLKSNGQALGNTALPMQKIDPYGLTSTNLPVGAISPGPLTVDPYSVVMLRLPTSPLVSVSGNNQQGTVGTKLSQPLVVRAVDSSGNPQSGITVQFAASAGQVSPISQVTNSQGQAQTDLTLGTTSGPVSVSATPSTGTPLMLSATAVSSAVSRITIQGATTGVTGTGLPFTATLYDQYGNIVVGSATPVSVTVSGFTGSFSPASPLTPSAGAVQTTFTASTTGSGSILFTSGSLSATQLLSVAAPLSIPTSWLSNGTVGAAYATTLQATGGTTPYTWSVSGSITPGLTLSSAGVLSGTPTTTGTFSTTYKVVDGAGRSSARSLNVRVY